MMNTSTSYSTLYQKQIENIDNEKLFKDIDKGEMQKYFLDLYFYKFLSVKLEKYINNELKDDSISYENAWENHNYKDDIIGGLKEYIGYIIEPKYLWRNIISKIEKDEFDNEYLAQARNAFNDSVLGHDSQETFEGIFDSMDLTSGFIGQNEKERSKFISSLIMRIDQLEIKEEHLGYFFEIAYNYYSLLAGKNKAGDFYTAPSISKLIAKIVTWDSSAKQKKKRVKAIYDSSCGSSSLMLHVKNELESIASFYGQDNKIIAVNFSKMNLIINDISYKNIDIHCNDVLDNPSQIHSDKEFDLIVSDFQFSQSWSGETYHARDERFSGYPKFAPKGTADYAFIQHMISLLSDDGKMVVHCPHGVLFRGDSEGEIRKYLVKDKNYIETIISLPNKLVTKNSPSTCLVVLSKCKTTEDVLFINANDEFKVGKLTNFFGDENINKIMFSYEKRTDIEKFSSVVKVSSIVEDENTIEKNNYNLNVPRYIDTFEVEDEIDIDSVLDEIEALDIEKEKLDREIKEYLKELGVGKYGKK